MGWRSELLGALAGELENWTPTKWYRRLIKKILLNMLMQEIKEEGE